MARDTLTRDQIVSAAIELLDADGIDGLSMRRLGHRLGSAATAVYWHVEDKDNLVGLAADELWGEVDLPDLDQVDWRTAATSMAAGMHAMLGHHPWLMQALSNHPVYGRGKARYDDHALAVFEKAGFVEAAADQASATVFVFVLGCALGPAAEFSLTRRLSRDKGKPEQHLADVAAQATEIAAQFPRLRQRLPAFDGASYSAVPDNTFEYGLAAILDGFESRLGRPAPPQAPLSHERGH
ncbi:TetR/AcrR family transcriptional regulator [Myceligenerans pegani]|uniref:TetR/AcrR family transcriptional regulator C-terminal domain-containing protein n=1 Tax=Myceligenerans pegani TaxID=2776917 RepID=A0ABR9MYW8_9MICO|nr:TetR/AcrR family transcriptional regulator C-terminal domain-containing protein [Myceligenerans sp. TRM 65318]MBE1876588.1 TetR/AcrR family transcriptional regulator C-terminal domain-containing protein [Myceligenerans sp. TRM 65318]MBE3018859.1 TetR/AcrR family transcriptional regulator C-terminal domain-containing protein [Myceligenerans sp. TRM 65318]